MLYAGTSGFSYPTWIGELYPPGTRRDELLSEYARRLNAVELHGAVHRLPSEAQFAAWAAQAPESFRFAVKLSERITDRRDLSLCAAFCARVQILGARLGPVLVQLPDELERDDDVLALLLDSLDPALHLAVELRHESWSSDEVDGLIASRGAVRVGSLAADAPLLYLRLREPPYEESSLRALAEQLDEALRHGRDAYCFFKHEDEPRGARYATRLLELATAGSDRTGC